MPALLALWKIAKITIPIPLAIIVGVFLWVQVDKASAVRLAVNEYVKDAVAGAEINKLKAENRTAEALAQSRLLLVEEARRRAEVATAALQAFQVSYVKAQEENDEFEEQIKILQNAPAPETCTVGGSGLSERLLD